MRRRIPAWGFRKNRHPDPWKGLTAGAIGGVGATLVMGGFQYLWGALGEMVSDGDSGSNGEDEGGGDGEQKSEPATERAAQILAEGVLDRDLRDAEKSVAGQVMHYGFGTAAGGVYGVLVEYLPEVSKGKGLPFGAGLMVAADEVAVPALGLSPPPNRTPASTHLYGFAAHLVYGLSCEWLRSEVRRILD